MTIKNIRLVYTESDYEKLLHKKKEFRKKTKQPNLSWGDFFKILAGVKQ